MRKLVIILLAGLVSTASAVSVVNSRTVPDSTDRSSWGHSIWASRVDTLLKELVHVWDGTANSKRVAVETVDADSAIVDTVDADVGYVSQRIRIGGNADDTITGVEVVAVDGSDNDSLVVTIGGKRISIICGTDGD